MKRAPIAAIIGYGFGMCLMAAQTNDNFGERFKSAWERRTHDEIHFRGKVQSGSRADNFSGKTIRIGVDPRFALIVKVESVTPAVTNFAAGDVVKFAIHSPTQIFQDRGDRTGVTYDFRLDRTIMDGETFYSFVSAKAVQTTNVSQSDVVTDLTVSISIPAAGASTWDKESRSLSFRDARPCFHVLVSNNSTNEIRLWKEDCSWGYEALSFVLVDDSGNRWRVTKQPRAWRSNYPRWSLLKPKEILVIEVNFADVKVWDGFTRPSNDSSLKVKLTAIYEVIDEKYSKEYKIWTGEVESIPVDVTFYN